MPAGRPTTCTPEVVRRAEDYLIHFQKYDDEFPSIAGLADTLGVTGPQVHHWADLEQNAEFRQILGKIKIKQERLLLNKGVTGEFNAAITKLVLGKHDYHEMSKTDNKHTGRDGGPIQHQIAASVKEMTDEEAGNFYRDMVNGGD